MEICQLYNLSSTKCGSYKNEQETIVLRKLDDDLGGRFKANIKITECDLICMRSEIPLNVDGLICPKHRSNLGIGYRPSSKCKYFDHPPSSKSKGEEISWPLFSFVRNVDPSFILGSLICNPCKMNLYKIKKSKEDDCDTEDENDDPNYKPASIIIDQHEKKSLREDLDLLCDIFKIERVRFQLSGSIKDCSISSINYFRSVYQKFQSKLADTFCNLVAPGQEQELKNILENKSKCEDNSVILHLKEAYESCSTKNARRSVLTLMPKEYAVSEICNLFQCSTYEARCARNAAKLYGACAMQPKKDRVYSRLSVEKAEHFINFLFTTGLLQEVAYGTTDLKFDSGDKMTVGNTILNGIYEHSVGEYIQYCKDLDYDRLGRTTLLKLLKKMKPHTRRKLSGVDSFVVEGVEAFEVSHDIFVHFTDFYLLFAGSEKLCEII
jgi:hypothetical protein